MSVTIELNNIELVGTWKYVSKNIDCICNRPLYMPTSDEVEKKNINTNNVVIGDCGHGMHQSCIDAFAKTYNTDNKTNSYVLCPIDRLEWKCSRDVSKYHVVSQ